MPAVAGLGRPAVALDREELYRLGDRNRHELQAATALIEGSEGAIELARMDARPGFTASVGVTNVGRRDDVAGFLLPPDDGRNALTVSLGFSLPLWGAKYRAGVEQAADELRVQTQYRAAARNAMEMAVPGRGGSLRDPGTGQIDLLDDVLIPQTEEALRATETAYQTGQLGVLDLLDGERALIDVRSTRARYLSDLLIALTDLERAIGTRGARQREDAMKKAVALGVVSFGLGVAITALVTVNPADWRWPSRLVSAFGEAPAAAAGRPADMPVTEEDREIPALAGADGRDLHVGPAGPVADGHGPGACLRGRHPEPSAGHGAHRPGVCAEHRRPHRAGGSERHRADHPHRRHPRPQRPADRLGEHEVRRLDRERRGELPRRDGGGGAGAVRHLQPTARDDPDGVPAGGRLRRTARDVGIPGDRRARAFARRVVARAARLLGHHRRADRDARARADAAPHAVGPVPGHRRRPSGRWTRPSTACTSRPA